MEGKDLHSALDQSTCLTCEPGLQLHNQITFGRVLLRIMWMKLLLFSTERSAPSGCVQQGVMTLSLDGLTLPI